MPESWTLCQHAGIYQRNHFRVLLVGGGFGYADREKYCSHATKQNEGTGKTKLEFSKELGIPRSTLQGYLKGDKCLRSDSIEEIAKRLDLPSAQLISRPVYAEEFVLFLLDTLQEELRMLHPQAQGLAREAAALLHAAFRLSAEWNRLDVHPTAAKTEDSEGLTYRHIPYEAHGEARMLYAYGMLVQKYLQMHWATIFFVVPFSNDRSSAARLAKLCTEHQLDPIHLSM